jgi:pimeloyl-ACP methyl ester carboxylesterase
MPRSKPSILIIPGACGLPEFYDGVMEPVAAKGYEIKALHIPTVGLKTGPREGYPPSIYDDAAFIAKETQALADQGKDVILIAHSYGGVPTTQSTEGLSKAVRNAAGKEGGIVRLAYMTCLVPAIGEKAMELLMDVPPELQVGLKPDVRGPLPTPAW